MLISNLAQSEWIKQRVIMIDANVIIFIRREKVFLHSTQGYALTLRIVISSRKLMVHTYRDFIIAHTRSHREVLG